jgi:putative tryptophan/tyrosine transport system substrate-binding protein
MRRRDFIAGLGAVAWPFAVRAQQAALPVIGFLFSSTSKEVFELAINLNTAKALGLTIPPDLLTGLGSAVAWPVAARAQLGERMRRVGVLMAGDANDPVMKTWVSAFTQAFAGLGWTDDRNMRMDVRWAGSGINRIRALAQELVGSQSDIIVAASTPATVAVQRETRTIPIVMANVAEPVVSGIVARLDRPGRNITGFALYETPLAGKWLQLLLEIAPELKRAAIMFNPGTAPVSVYMPSFETAARSLKVVPIPAPVHSDIEIGTAIIAALGREPGAGLVVMPDTFMGVHRAPIISAAARNNVPAVYGASDFARDGGLLSYAPDFLDHWRRAALYVDRILRGAKPAELPVQLPTKFEMVVNLKTAKALGLDVPLSLQQLADEVIESKRREFIAGVGGAAAWPLAARAQQRTKPVIGMLDNRSWDVSGPTPRLVLPGSAISHARDPFQDDDGFFRGLAEVGFLRDRDMTIDYRTTAGHPERLPALAADLVRQRPAAIIAFDGPIAVAARAATRDIPIIFFSGFDPVELGLVASLNRPGGNLTGVVLLNVELAEKRLQLLHEAVPTTETIAFLVIGPADNSFNQVETGHMQSADRTLGLRLLVFNMTWVQSSRSDLFSVAAAFTALVEQRAGAVLMSSSIALTYRTDEILSHAARFALPTMCFHSVSARAGGLLSYGPDLNETFRQVGAYTGRILKGEKPADLPVQQATKLELVINLQTAKALAEAIPVAVPAIKGALRATVGATGTTDCQAAARLRQPRTRHAHAADKRPAARHRSAIGLRTEISTPLLASGR